MVMARIRYKNRTFDSIWDDPRTFTIQTFGYNGLTIKAIAHILNVGEGVVSYRLWKLGISPAEFRRGESERAKAFIRRNIDTMNRRLFNGTRQNVRRHDAG